MWIVRYKFRFERDWDYALFASKEEAIKFYQRYEHISDVEMEPLRNLKKEVL